MALGKFTIREIGNRPGRAILTLLSVVIGVATVVSVNIAAQTTRQANKEIYETVAGRASLEVVAETGGPFPQSVLDEVAKVHGVANWTFKQADGTEEVGKAAVPLIRTGAMMSWDLKKAEAAAAQEPAEDELEEGGVKRQQVDVQILGIDPIKDGAIRNYQLIAGRPIHLDKSKESKEGASDKDGAAPNDSLVNGKRVSPKRRILMDNNFASGLGLTVGQTVRFTVPGGKRKEYTIVGLIAPKGASAVGMGVVYMNLESVQELMGAQAQIDTIQIVTDDGAVEQVKQDIASLLPAGLVVRSPAMRTSAADETLMSTEQGLMMATYFSWLLALLIVLNTFQMNVVERRRQLAILRAIGATRGQVMGTIFREGLCMGLLGTLLGLIAGIGGAKLISLAMARVMQSPLPALEISWTTLVLAAVVGPAVSVLGALLPAWRAGKLSPMEGMGAVLPSEIEAPRSTLFILGTIVALAGGMVLGLCIHGTRVTLPVVRYVADKGGLQWEWYSGPLPINWSVIATLVILIGLVLMIPFTLRPLTFAAGTLFSPLLRVEGRLAEGQIVRRRGRTTLTVGVLFLAIAFGVGMAITIVDNVADLKNWVQTTIVDDFFIRPTTLRAAAGNEAGKNAGEIPASLEQQVRDMPGIKRVQAVRYKERLMGKQVATVIVGEYGKPEGRQLVLMQGDPNTLLEELERGNAVIGSVLASRANLKVGDTLPITVPEGHDPIRVVGIANEYMFGGLTVHMRPKPAAEMLDITRISALVIKADPGQAEQVGASLRSLVVQKKLVLQSQKELKTMIDGMMVGVVGCLWFLLVLVFVVSAFGVVNTLTMNVIEQTRELGLLRIVAMTRNQVRKLIVSQATLLAIIGLAPGVIAGLSLAWFLNLSAETVLGRHIDFNMHPLVIMGCFFVAFLIVLLAAWFPANRAAKLKLAEALQYQ